MAPPRSPSTAKGTTAWRCATSAYSLGPTPLPIRSSPTPHSHLHARAYPLKHRPSTPRTPHCTSVRLVKACAPTPRQKRTCTPPIPPLYRLAQSRRAVITAASRFVAPPPSATSAAPAQRGARVALCPWATRVRRGVSPTKAVSGVPALLVRDDPLPAAHPPDLTRATTNQIPPSRMPSTRTNPLPRTPRIARSLHSTQPPTHPRIPPTVPTITSPIFSPSIARMRSPGMRLVAAAVVSTQLRQCQGTPRCPGSRRLSSRTRPGNFSTLWLRVGWGGRATCRGWVGRREVWRGWRWGWRGC